MTDICLIVEGSYPYVKGGVASWIQQLIKNNPEFSFTVVALLATEKDITDLKYKLPKNLISLQHVFIRKETKKPILMPFKMKEMKFIKSCIDNNSIVNYEKLTKVFLKNKPIQKLMYSLDTFRLIKSLYFKHFNDMPFMNFFWSMRGFIHGFANVLCSDIPEAKLYHTVSTGYAGLFSTLCKIKYPKSKLILTEHGIYTRERKMDITISDWSDRRFNDIDPTKSISAYRDLWEMSFNEISKLTYHYCDKIYSLNKKNNDIQIEEGAEKSKVSFIRNGVSLSKFKYTERKSIERLKIGFLGRVVKIKDVKTFIKSAAYIVNIYPDIEFLIAGPTEEDKDYYESCLDLVNSLSLSKNIKFLGNVNSANFFKDIDLMVLTSLSEGQPLVIAEANACGVPVVATDVGGCKEMIFGDGVEDTLGQAGEITKPLEPKETAKAILRLIEDPKLYNTYSRIAHKRANLFYNEETFKSKYNLIYKGYVWQA